jgi:hypothetical protein
MVGWLVGWLISWLVGWLVGCLVGWLVGCLVGWLVGWFYVTLLHSVQIKFQNLLVYTPVHLLYNFVHFTSS